MTEDAAEPYIGSTNYEWLHATDVIVAWDADRDRTLLETCGTWRVTAVDFTPVGPCCLPAGHMSITTDRDLRRHQPRDEQVKIIAPVKFWRLANTCHAFGWHLRRSSDGIWHGARIGADNLYRRFWPNQQDTHFPGRSWGWDATYHGRLLGSGTGYPAACLMALEQITPPDPSSPGADKGAQ